MSLPLPPELRRILLEAPAFQRAFLVGGCVRDARLGRPVKDFDIEVHGLNYEELVAALQPFGRVDYVGRSFGVAKLSLAEGILDFSIPRRDSKTGQGHRGFALEFDPTLTLAEATARRDFTVNALLYDPRQCEVLDFHGGLDDLDHRRLRHTGPAFAEDPLRVLRGMQFCARFDLTPAPETIELCRSITDTYLELPVERVREEWWKWATRSSRPSLGLRFLEATGWIRHLPELAALRGVPQDPEWHPEGDVLEHTCHCLDALVTLPEWLQASDDARAVWSFAILTHDLGKALCTETVQRGGRLRIGSPGHEAASGPLTESLLARIGIPQTTVQRVLPLVVNHMAHLHEPSERAVRRLARRLEPETVERLCVVMTADAMGRPPLPARAPAGVLELQRVADSLRLSQAAPKPVLLGRHLLALGFPPGRTVGQWTAAAFEAQLDGRFHDLAGAHAWLAAQEDFPEPARSGARHFVQS